MTRDREGNQTENTLPINIARTLYFLIAFIWFIFGVTWIFRVINPADDLGLFGLMMPLLVFGNSFVLFLIGWKSDSGKRGIYLFGVGYLLLNILLTVTDEFGIFDLVTLILDIGLLLLLIFTRAIYLTIDQQKVEP